jgi:hypothetical protein
MIFLDIWQQSLSEEFGHLPHQVFAKLGVLSLVDFQVTEKRLFGMGNGIAVSGVEEGDSVHLDEFFDIKDDDVLVSSGIVRIHFEEIPHHSFEISAILGKILLFSLQFLFLSVLYTIPQLSECFKEAYNYFIF